MDVSSSAITGSIRVGLQILTNYKKPVLEIYHHVMNQIGPEQEYTIPKGSSGIGTEVTKLRYHDIRIYFTLVNIGGTRAENVDLRISGDLKRDSPRENFGEIFNITIPQIAPGQIVYLFSFDRHDLMEYPEGGGKPLCNKDQSFTITMAYEAPKGIINWILSLRSRFCGKKRFFNAYTFPSKLVLGELPPAEYA